MQHPNETDAMLSLLRQRVSYDKDSGVLTWRSCGVELFKDAAGWARWHGKYSSKPVGKRSRGYVIVTVTVDGKERYLQGHRVAWALTTGVWPALEIDHCSTDQTDNRWTNLRLATSQQNACNKSISKRNRSGFKGVHQHTQNGNWIAQIGVAGKRRHLGAYESPEAAAAAREKAAIQLHGQFART